EPLGSVSVAYPGSIYNDAIGDSAMGPQAGTPRLSPASREEEVSKRRVVLPVTLFFRGLLGLAATEQARGKEKARTERIEYPPTHRGDTVDDYHGTKVPDPYRWLEDDVRKSKEVAEWVAAENRVTKTYLETIPERERIRKRLTELWNYARYSA